MICFMFWFMPEQEMNVSVVNCIYLCFMFCRIHVGCCVSYLLEFVLFSSEQLLFMKFLLHI